MKGVVKIKLIYVLLTCVLLIKHTFATELPPVLPEAPPTEELPSTNNINTSYGINELRALLSNSIYDLTSDYDSLKNQYRLTIINIIYEYAKDTSNTELITMVDSFKSIKEIPEPELLTKLNVIYEDLSKHSTDAAYIDQNLYTYRLTYSILADFVILYNYLVDMNYDMSKYQELVNLSIKFQELAPKLNTEINIAGEFKSKTDYSVGELATDIFLEEFAKTSKYLPFISKSETDPSLKKKVLYKSSGLNIVFEVATLNDIIKSYETGSKDSYYIREGIYIKETDKYVTEENTSTNKYFAEEVLVTKLDFTFLVMYNNLENKNSIANSIRDMPVYMDAIGNILTEDNTIIVPACVNSVFYKDSIPVMSRAFVNSYPRLNISESSIKLKNKSDKDKIFMLKNKDGEIAIDVIGKYTGSRKPLNIFSGFNKVKIYTEYMPLQNTKEDLFTYNKVYANEMEIFGTGNELMNYQGVSIENEDTVMTSRTLNSDFEIAIEYFKYYLNMNILKEPKIQKYIIKNGQYDNINYKAKKEEFNIFTNIVGGISGGFMFLGNIENNLGIQHPMESYLSGFIHKNMRNISLVLIIMTVIGMIIHCIKNNKSIIIVGISVGLIYGLILFIILFGQYYFQNINNKIINDFNQDVVFGTLITLNELTISDEVEFIGMSKNKPEISNPSITLAKGNYNELKTNESAYGTDFINNEWYIGNSDTYRYNNEVRIRIKDLFELFKIEGEYIIEGNSKYFKLKSKKIEDSNIDYFMPYSLIMDGFIETLNTYSMISEEPVRQVYVNNKVHNSFLVNSFFHSVLYFYPSNESYIRAFTNEKNKSEVYSKIESVLNEKNIIYEGTIEGNTESYLYDYLNIRRLLTREDIADSLWAKTLIHNGYEKDLDTLIITVNAQTSRFALKCIDRFNYVSDETLIKVISLYATCVFNEAVSDVMYNIYPQHINSYEINLSNILQTILTCVENINSPSTLDLSYYLITKVDFFGALSAIYIYSTEFFINTFLSFFLVSLLYWVSFIMLLRLTFNIKGKIFRGLMKITLIGIISYILNSVKYTICYNINLIEVKLLTLMITNLFLCVSIMVIIKNILADPLTLNGKINTNSHMNKITDLLNIKELKHNNNSGYSNTDLYNYNSTPKMYNTNDYLVIHDKIKTDKFISKLNKSDYIIKGNTIKFKRLYDYYEYKDYIDYM